MWHVLLISVLLQISHQSINNGSPAYSLFIKQIQGITEGIYLITEEPYNPNKCSVGDSLQWKREKNFFSKEARNE